MPQKQHAAARAACAKTAPTHQAQVPSWIGESVEVSHIHPQVVADVLQHRSAVSPNTMLVLISSSMVCNTVKRSTCC